MPGIGLEEVQTLLSQNYEFLVAHLRGIAMSGFLGIEELKAVARGAVRTAAIAGGAAGDHTVSGIAVGDRLRSVIALNPAHTHTENTAASYTQNADTASGGAVAPSDLTGEFSISAADTISNAGGTDTTGQVLVVVYEDWTP